MANQVPHTAGFCTYQRQFVQQTIQYCPKNIYCPNNIVQKICKLENCDLTIMFRMYHYYCKFAFLVNLENYLPPPYPPPETPIDDIITRVYMNRVTQRGFLVSLTTTNHPFPFDTSPHT